MSGRLQSAGAEVSRARLRVGRRRVRVALRGHDVEWVGYSPDRFEAWVDRLRVADLAGYETRERSVRATGPARIARVATVTERFFDVLGLPAASGVAPPLPVGDPRAVVSTRLAASLETAPAAAGGLGITVGEPGRSPSSPVSGAWHRQGNSRQRSCRDGAREAAPAGAIGFGHALIGIARRSPDRF